MSGVETVGLEGGAGEEGQEDGETGAGTGAGQEGGPAEGRAVRNTVPESELISSNTAVLHL